MKSAADAVEHRVMVLERQMLSLRRQMQRTAGAHKVVPGRTVN